MTVKDDILSRTEAAVLSPEEVLRHLFPPQAEESRITLSCRRADYSASAIARAVEDCNAHLINLNVTGATDDGLDPLADDIVVEIRISHRNGMAVARSLDRYGINVVSVLSGSDADIVAARERVNELIHYLDV